MLWRSAFALRCREDDTAPIVVISELGDAATPREANAEWMLLRVLQGHGNSPIAGYAQFEVGGELSLRDEVFTPSGKTVLSAHEWAGPLDPAILGTSVAVSLLRQDVRELIDGFAH